MKDFSDNNGSGSIKRLTELELKSLFDEHYEMVCAVAFKITGNQEAAEDIAQELFLGIWNKRYKLEIKSSAKAYMYKSAYNASINYVNKHKFMRSTDDQYMDVPGTENPGEKLETKELQNDYQHALEKLPEACRTVFLMSRYDNLSYKLIAETMGISIKTVENHIGKALKILRKELKKYIVLL